MTSMVKTAALLAAAMALMSMAAATGVAQSPPTLPEHRSIPLEFRMHTTLTSGRNYAQARETLRDVQLTNEPSSSVPFIAPYGRYRQWSGGECVVESLDIHMNINLYYPEWLQYDAGSADDHAAWDAYIAQLELHTNIHVVLAYIVVLEVRERILDVSFGDGIPCSEIEDAMNEEIETAYDRITQLEALYDSQTGHGANQAGFSWRRLVAENPWP